MSFPLVVCVITIVLCFSVYALYPLVIVVLGRLFPLSVRRAETTPSVSIIIAACNEAVHMARKIENTLALRYPEDKLEILVGSDGSTDATAEIARACGPRVQVVEYGSNRGKTAVQNDLAELARNEILVFTDAASFVAPEAIEKMARNFADARVGCVAGRMRFAGTDSNLTTQSQGLFWRYEALIRRTESSLGRLIGVDGPLYAVRRECYVPLEYHVISDFITPLLVLQQGRKVVLESDAVVDEEPTTRAEQEFATRRRITVRGLVGLFAHRSLLNPLKHPLLTIQIVFHKLLRWFVGVLVLLNLIACLTGIEQTLFRGLLALHGLFFALAAAGWIARRRGVSVRALAVPYYFTLVNAAATVGIVDFLRGRRVVSWKPVREGS